MSVGLWRSFKAAQSGGMAPSMQCHVHEISSKGTGLLQCWEKVISWPSLPQSLEICFTVI